VAVIAAAVVIAGADAGIPVGAKAPSLTTKAGVYAYLQSHGINPKGFVIQRGSHNYALPSCGALRSCTTAKKVLQFGPRNTFQCSASNLSGGSANPPDGCTIVQVAQTAGASNVATCTESDSSPAASQSCVIFQQSSSGTNTASVTQTINVAGIGQQDTTQYSGIDQASGDGANNAKVTQTVVESTSSPGTNSGGTEQQDGHQGSSINQFATGAGNNSAGVTQSLALSAMTSGVKTISQLQNTNETGSPNTNSDIEQNSGTGTNTATLNQTNNLNAFAAGATAGVQTQGASTNGMNGMFNQFSSGVSTITGSQVERQSEISNTSLPSTVSQTQYDPAWLDPQQRGNGSDTYNLSQNSAQNENLPGGFQDGQEYAECFTDGTCTANQQITQNGQSSSNSCGPASSCDIGVTQTKTSEGTSSSTCGTSLSSETEGCDVGFPQPPLSPCDINPNSNFCDTIDAPRLD
jgi:hypothetical protein